MPPEIELVHHVGQEAPPVVERRMGKLRCVWRHGAFFRLCGVGKCDNDEVRYWLLIFLLGVVISATEAADPVGWRARRNERSTQGRVIPAGAVRAVALPTMTSLADFESMALDRHPSLAKLVVINARRAFGPTPWWGTAVRKWATAEQPACRADSFGKRLSPPGN